MKAKGAYCYSIAAIQNKKDLCRRREGSRGDRKAPGRARRREILLPQYKTRKIYEDAAKGGGSRLACGKFREAERLRSEAEADRPQSPLLAPAGAKSSCRNTKQQAKIARRGDWAPTADDFCVMYKTGNRLAMAGRTAASGGVPAGGVFGLGLLVKGGEKGLGSEAGIEGQGAQGLPADHRVRAQTVVAAIGAVGIGADAALVVGFALDHVGAAFFAAAAHRKRLPSLRLQGQLNHQVAHGCAL